MSILKNFITVPRGKVISTQVDFIVSCGFSPEDFVSEPLTDLLYMGSFSLVHRLDSTH